MHIYNRNELLKSIKLKTNLDFSTNPSYEEISQEIFKSDDITILNAIGKYIKSAFEERENATFHILPQNYTLYLKNRKTGKSLSVKYLYLIFYCK